MSTGFLQGAAAVKLVKAEKGETRWYPPCVGKCVAAALVGLGVEADLHGAFANFHGVNTLHYAPVSSYQLGLIKGELGNSYT